MMIISDVYSFTELAKEIRHDVYKKMLKQIEECLDFDEGFCYLLMVNCGKSPLSNFPELMKHKPEVTLGKWYWFPNNEEGKVE